MPATLPLTDTAPPPPATRRRRLVPRHSLLVRLTHWLNAACLCVLVMSGAQIFNAYPRLHWGAYGADFDRAWLEIESLPAPGGGWRGALRIGTWELPTTGVLGASPQPQAFPGWLTLPSYRDLATGRRWHFFFAWVLVLNGLVYLVGGLLRRHFSRDLLPTRAELAPRHLWHEVREHARLRFPKGEAARRYNVLQKLAYLAVVFGLLPLMVLTGWTMSPGLDAAAPWLLELFGGRASARSLHFLGATGLVAFVAVHLAMVVAAGPWNHLRSMITGRYAIDDATPADDDAPRRAPTRRAAAATSTPRLGPAPTGGRP